MKTRTLLMISLSFLTMSCAKAPSAPVESAAETAVSIPVAAETSTAPTTPELAAHPDNKPGNDFDELWGQKVADPYRWLENAADPAVQDWMKAQDVRARDWLKQLPSRDSYVKSLSNLLYVPSISTPNVKNGRAFYFERGAHDEKSILYVRDLNTPDAPPRVLLDPNKLSADGSIAIGNIFPTSDGKLMAYTLKPNNADQAVLYVMNVDTGENLPDKIEAARYAHPFWLKDNSGFYYTHFPIDPAIPVDARPGKTDIRFHAIGTPESDDKVLIDALNDATKFHDVYLSEDTRWLKYTIQDGWNGNTLKIQDRIAKNTPWVELPTKPNTTYIPKIIDNFLYLYTNDGAPRYKIVKIDLKSSTPDLSEKNWQTIVPEFSDRVIERFTIADNKLFVVSIKDVVNLLDVYDLNGKHLKSIELPDLGTLGGMTGTSDAEYLYFKFTSYKLPASVYRLNTQTLEVSMWSEIKTTAKTEDVISEQLFATSKDGTKVPMFVLRHKDTPLDGTAKTMIYGYGGFNVAITPTFNANAHAWVEQGGIYVFSVLRGGSEYGETWHQDGMKLKKQNVFDDYYAVAEHLIANKYTRSESLAAYGGSNGGLLVGAALTQRPDLYGAIVCAVPLLDMVRYQMFGSGRTWIGEYGSVENSEEEFNAIRAYSPYSNVKQTAYPSVLFLGADSDDRVDPMHARKMTAIIQDSTTSDAPVLLRIEKNAGHGGADLTTQNIEKFADVFAYLQQVLK